MTAAKSRTGHESSSKRKEQNRVAQRAFRKRQREYYRELEQQVVDMASKIKTLTKTNVDLQSAMKRLQKENLALKRSSASSTSGLAPAPSLPEELAQEDPLCSIAELEAPGLLPGVQNYPSKLGPLVFDDRSRTSSPSGSSSSSGASDTQTPVTASNGETGIHQPIYGDDGSVLGISPLSLGDSQMMAPSTVGPPQKPASQPQPTYEVINTPQLWYQPGALATSVPPPAQAWPTNPWNMQHSQSLSEPSTSAVPISRPPEHRASLPSSLPSQLAPTPQPAPKNGWRNANLHLSISPAQHALYREQQYMVSPSDVPPQQWAVPASQWSALAALKSVGNGDVMAFPGGNDVITPVFEQAAGYC